MFDMGDFVLHSHINITIINTVWQKQSLT